MDPSTPPLPAVNPAGGGWGSPLDGLPLYGGVLTGQAQAASPPATLYGQNQPPKFAPQPMGAPGRGDWAIPALPAFSAPAEPQTPDPNHSAAYNAVTSLFSNPKQKAESTAVAVNPGVSGAIHNFFFNPVGGADAATYAAKSAAHSTIASDDGQAYLARFPSLNDAALHNPVQFAQALGPILEAHQKELAGGGTPGAVPYNTVDGVAHYPVSDTDRLAALQKSLGLTPHGAALLMDPSHTTQSQWVKHAQAAGITNNQLKMMWEMQHYLSPQQQAAQEQLGLAHQMYTATDGGNAAQERLRQQLQLIQAPTPALSQ